VEFELGRLRTGSEWPVFVSPEVDHGTALYNRRLKGHPVQRQRSRILDMFYLVGAAVLLCVLGVGASIAADIYHVNPLWVMVSFISVGFFAGAREDYRTEFR